MELRVERLTTYFIRLGHNDWKCDQSTVNKYNYQFVERVELEWEEDLRKRSFGLCRT